MIDLHIAHDKEESTEFEPVYFVYQLGYKDGVVIYRGSYTQCLVVIGAYSMVKMDMPEPALREINERCNGYLVNRYHMSF
jgi:hypothetical protein